MRKWKKIIAGEEGKKREEEKGTKRKMNGGKCKESIISSEK